MAGLTRQESMGRIYEFRPYKLHPGKLRAFKKRFEEDKRALLHPSTGSRWNGARHRVGGEEEVHGLAR